MRGFKSKGLSRLSVPDSNELKTTDATECSTCTGGSAVRTAGQEDAGSPSAVSEVPRAQVDPTKPGDDGPTNDAPQEKENATIVMKGPAGHLMTAALNKAFAFENSANGIAGHAHVAVEDIANTTSHVDMDALYANGMMDDPARGVVRMSKAVGVIPMPGETPTALNTIIDALQKSECPDVAFVMINQQKGNVNAARDTTAFDFATASNPNVQDGKSVGALDTEPAKATRPINSAMAAGTQAAIESIEVIIRYRA